MIRMIVTDLDHTLLREDSTLAPRTLAALQACRDKGILIAYATARSKHAAAPMTAAFSPDIFIGYGGALTLIGDEELRRVDLAPEFSHALIRDCLAAPEITSVSVTNDTVALSNRAPRAHSRYTYTDFAQALPHRYLKIQVAATDPQAVAAIATRYPLCDMMRYNGETTYRFAHRDAAKWHATSHIATHYNIPIANIAAFGDDVNDVDMLIHCGQGIAPANATNAAKNAANHICADNEQDGVAEWLEKNLLSPTHY